MSTIIFCSFCLSVPKTLARAAVAGWIASLWSPGWWETRGFLPFLPLTLNSTNDTLWWNLTGTEDGWLFGQRGNAATTLALSVIGGGVCVWFFFRVMQYYSYYCADFRGRTKSLHRCWQVSELAYRKQRRDSSSLLGHFFLINDCLCP